MKPTGLLVAVILLAGLGGLIWWSNKKQATAGASTTVADAAKKLLSIPDDQFQSIRIQKTAAETEDLDLDDPGIVADIDDLEAYRGLIGAPL